MGYVNIEYLENKFFSKWNEYDENLITFEELKNRLKEEQNKQGYRAGAIKYINREINNPERRKKEKKKINFRY